jgi:hypothetical protein
MELEEEEEEVSSKLFCFLPVMSFSYIPIMNVVHVLLLCYNTWDCSFALSMRLHFCK